MAGHAQRPLIPNAGIPNDARRPPRPRLEQRAVRVLRRRQPQRVQLHEAEGRRRARRRAAPQRAHDLQRGRRLAGAGHAADVQALAQAARACAPSAV